MLNFQRSARGSISAGLGVNIVRFDEFSNFDSEDLRGNFDLNFPAAAGSPFSGGINFGYTEDTLVDDFVNDRIASDSTNASISGQYQFRPRLSGRASLSYNDRNSARYSDLEETTASVGLVLSEVWQNVGVTLDLRERDLNSSGEIGNARDGKDTSISIGLTGPILPEGVFNRLEAYGSISFDKVDSTITRDGGDRDVIGYDGSLTWRPRETTSVSLTFNKGVQNTVTDDAVENSRISLGMSQQFDGLTAGSIGLYTQSAGYFGTTRDIKTHRH